MNVKQLKEVLKNLPDEMEVILQKDAEGNDFSSLSETNTECVYLPLSAWSGEVFCMRMTADELGIPESTYQKIKAEPRSLILIPVN